MSKTFSQLGMKFPLFDAAAEGTEYVGNGTCSICNVADMPCFELGIGTALLIDCPGCGTINGLDVHGKHNVKCRNCNVLIEFPSVVAAKKEPKICYGCLRAGKATLTKDTEFGIVSWEQAFSGFTNGGPGLRQNQFESVVVDQEENWVKVKLPEDIMFELLRTPTYSSWQGERWLFCCRYPMTFIGEWNQEEFDRHASDGNGEALYYSVVEDIPADTWDALGNSISVYLFQCKGCGKLRAHWDCD
jgi:uncharacterized protein CbrC (UPF0167 family)